MNLFQRTATINDAEILLTWRNHPSIRSFARQPEQILEDEHMRWLAARLKKVHAEPFYLFVEDSRPVGMTRLDMIPGSIDRYELSILVDPNQQGKGMGTKILSLTCESIFSLYPNKVIVAYTNKANYISQKLFRSANFRLLPSIGDFLHFEKSLN